MYQFSPPGSRKIEAISALSPRQLSGVEFKNSTVLLVHDQEPLDARRYNSAVLETDLSGWYANNFPGWEEYFNNNINIRKHLVEQNLAALFDGIFIKDKHILLHSELNSTEVEFYNSCGFETAYWWSHALIALDWYRFAKLDTRLSYDNSFSLDYNIYNRSWSGTREYRLKFAELLSKNNLVDCSSMRFNSADNGVHYTDHVFENPAFEIDYNLDHFEQNTASSTSSAGYNADDYRRCWIDVVLETVYDDSRWHLTEKALRPIACGKPFLLVATARSLEYLHSYGFQTYNTVWDEGYDQIEDPLERLEAVTDLMLWISENKNSTMVEKCAQIANFNRARFFSKEFFGQVTDELKKNIQRAYNKTENHKKANRWFNFYTRCKSEPITRKLSIEENEFRNRKDVADLLRYYRKNR